MTKMSEYITVKEMKDIINGCHERWDDWLILFGEEPVLRNEFDITFRTGYEYEYEEDDDE